MKGPLEKELGLTRVYNNSGEAVPPFGVMQVADAGKTDGEPYIEIDKPDGSGTSYMLNGAFTIGIDAYGFGSVAYGKRAALDSGETAPSVGDEWGAKSGQWTLSPDGSGFIVVGDVASNTARVRVAASETDKMAVVTVYHSTLSDGEAVDPQGANRYFDGTLDSAGDIWIEALDTIGNSDVRCQLPAAGKFLGLLQGTWDPDPEGTSDERPLYKIQPQHPGVVLGLVTASGTAADWSSTTAPTVGSCTVTLFNYTEAGALEVFDTGVTVAFMAETSPDAGSIVYCGMFEGYWHVISKLCSIASGYSE